MKFVIVLAITLAAVRAQSLSPVAIVKQSSDVNPDGSYQYNFETQNGIIVQEQGQLSNAPEPGTIAQGSFEYTGPDGVLYSVKYVADELGFQPTGEHLPTPPPIPLQIARALEWSATHPYKELTK